MTTLAMVGCTPSTAAVARRRSSVRTRTRRRSFPDDDIKTLSSVDTNATATEEEEEEEDKEEASADGTSVHGATVVRGAAERPAPGFRGKGRQRARGTSTTN